MRRVTVFAVILSFLSGGVVFAGSSANVTVKVKITQSLSVSVTPSSLDLGSGTENGTLQSTATALSAKNDGNVAEKFTITVNNSANWRAGTAAGSETFAAKVTTDGSTWNIINPTGGFLFANSVAGKASKAFGIQILLPTTTSYGGIEQGIPLTVTASL